MINYGYVYEKIRKFPFFSFSCKKKGKNGSFWGVFPTEKGGNFLFELFVNCIIKNHIF